MARGPIFALGVLAHPACGESALPPDDRDALAELWGGVYDMTEEIIASEASPEIGPAVEQQRVQINVRRVPLPWMGTHVLYVEEYPYDEPFEIRRRVLLSIEPARGADGALRVRQFTRKPTGNASELTAADVESVPGCDLFLKREGGQFRGGTRGKHCVEDDSHGARWLDYRIVLGDGLFWYRKRRLALRDDDLAEEVAGFPYVDLDEARLFTCGISWTAPKSHASRKPLTTVDLHDRGGRARFRTPDGRELQLELHGRDWPLSAGRESLVLILTEDDVDGEPIASSWTSLGAARVGIDIGSLAIDCAPVVSDAGDQRS